MKDFRDDYRLPPNSYIDSRSSGGFANLIDLLDDRSKYLQDKPVFSISNQDPKLTSSAKNLQTQSTLDSMLPKKDASLAWDSSLIPKRKRKPSPDQEVQMPLFKTASEEYQQSRRKKMHTDPSSLYKAAPNPSLTKPYICPVKSSGSSSLNLKADQLIREDEPVKLKGIEDKLVEIIENEIISRNPEVKWEQIAGLEFAKKAVMEAIVWPLLRPDIFRGIRAPPKGLLLFGPPGTGKTMIGKAIASEAKATFFNISSSCLTSKWVGEGEKLVKVLFSLAVMKQPSVIFIDEIDSLLTARQDCENEATRRIKTEFLVQLDGAATNPNDRILVIGATNRPQDLDEAIRRRMSKRLYIPLPNLVGRLQLLKTICSTVDHTLTEKDYSQISNLSRGYSGADIQELCKEAAMNPLRNIPDIREVNLDDIRPLEVIDFTQALRVVKATVNPRDLSSLEEWNDSYGSFQFDKKEIEM